MEKTEVKSYKVTENYTRKEYVNAEFKSYSLAQASHEILLPKEKECCRIATD